MALEIFKDTFRLFTLTEKGMFDFSEGVHEKIRYHPERILQKYINEEDGGVRFSREYSDFFEKNLISVALNFLGDYSFGTVFAAGEESKETEEILRDFQVIVQLLRESMVLTMNSNALPSRFYFRTHYEQSELLLIRKYCNTIVANAGWQKKIESKPEDLLGQWVLETGTFSYINDD